MPVTSAMMSLSTGRRKYTSKQNVLKSMCLEDRMPCCGVFIRHKVVWWHTWGYVESLMIMLLRVFSWSWQWKNVGNRLVFGEVIRHTKMVQVFWPILYICYCLWCIRQLLIIQMAKQWLATHPVRHRVQCHVTMGAGTALWHRQSSTATEHQLQRPAASGPIVAQRRQLPRCRHVLIGLAVVLAQSLVLAVALHRRPRMWWEVVECRLRRMSLAMMPTNRCPVRACVDTNWKTCCGFSAFLVFKLERLNAWVSKSARMTI